MADPSWAGVLAAVVRDRVFGQKPDPAVVLDLLRSVHEGLESTGSQCVRWDVEAWRRGLTGTALVGSIDAVVDGLQRDGDHAWITREHVFSFAQHPNELFVAMMAWGFGPSGYGWYRTRSVFEAGGGSRIPQLIGALRAVAGSPEQTWNALRGTARLRGLGPAFGTKLAYFAGYDRARGCGPLIADRWTAWAYWALAGNWDIRRSGRCYGHYVDTATSWAADLSIGDKPAVHSDDLERALFAAGPHVLQAWQTYKMAAAGA